MQSRSHEAHDGNCGRKRHFISYPIFLKTEMRTGKKTVKCQESLDEFSSHFTCHRAETFFL